MSRHPRVTQALWLGVAAVLLAAAGQLQPRLVKLGTTYELVQDSSPGGSDLEALLTIAPGGLRAPVVNYLWIRAEELKQQGKFYDAMQLADLICSLQPYFPGVWSFHSWNMAWNISVATHTPEERWMWVTNGMRLLRDRGIPVNPRSLILYKDLAWLFFSKMGSNLDDMHVVYKQRWAAEMQRLLGSPPQGQTSEVIDAFRPIAAAPVDKAAPAKGARISRTTSSRSSRPIPAPPITSTGWPIRASPSAGVFWTPTTDSAVTRPSRSSASNPPP